MAHAYLPLLVIPEGMALSVFLSFPCHSWTTAATKNTIDPCYHLILQLCQNTERAGAPLERPLNFPAFQLIWKDGAPLGEDARWLTTGPRGPLLSATWTPGPAGGDWEDHNGGRE